MDARIIIPIMLKSGEYWDNFLPRLFCSIKNIKKTSDIPISIIDVSKESHKELFNGIHYYHIYLEEEFCRAKVLNTAINYFSADYYIISDHDIIYKDNHLNNILNKMVNKFDLYVPKVRRGQKELYTDNCEDIINHTLGEAPGNIILSKNLFLTIHGFNEKYYISGLEDCDFIERTKFFGKNIMYGLEEDCIYSLWHPQWYDDIKYKTNKIIYRKFMEDYISKGNLNWNTYDTPAYEQILKEVKNGQNSTIQHLGR